MFVCAHKLKWNRIKNPIIKVSSDDCILFVFCVLQETRKLIPNINSSASTPRMFTWFSYFNRAMAELVAAKGVFMELFKRSQSRRDATLNQTARSTFVKQQYVKIIYNYNTFNCMCCASILCGRNFIPPFRLVGCGHVKYVERHKYNIVWSGCVIIERINHLDIYLLFHKLFPNLSIPT